MARTDPLEALVGRDTGATAVEYALMVALIALVIFGAVTVLGLNLSDLFADPVLSTALD